MPSIRLPERDGALIDRSRGQPAVPERLLEASSEELEGVPGVPAKVGREIHAALHRTGGA